MPQEVRSALAEFQQTAAASLDKRSEVRWVRNENLHLTLKFFGEVSEERLDPLEKALQESGNQSASFELEVKGAGCFPNLSNARVLWAGAGNEVTGLAKAVEKSTVSAGFEAADRAFSPHLTLARLGSKPGAALQQIVTRYQDFSFGKFTVTDMILFQSRLRSGGPQYTELKKFPLSAH